MRAPPRRPAEPLLLRRLPGRIAPPCSAPFQTPAASKRLQASPAPLPTLPRLPQVWSLGQPTPNFTLEGHDKGVNCVDYFTGGDRWGLLFYNEERTGVVSPVADAALERADRLVSVAPLLAC